MFILQRSEQRIIFKPVRLLLLERFKSDRRFVLSGLQIVRMRGEKIGFDLMRSTVVDWTNRPFFQIRLVQQSLVDNRSGLSSVLPANAE